MKQLLFLAVLFISVSVFGQNPPASPPAKVSETTDKGTTITINYSQPSVKGRTIGKDLEPMEGKIWRTGANKATVFEVNKDVMVEGKKLSAGKYGLFTLFDDNDIWVIFNKTYDQWGAYDYKEADDALRVKVKSGKTKAFSEKMTFVIDKKGKVSLMWGDKQADFTVI